MVLNVILICFVMVSPKHLKYHQEFSTCTEVRSSISLSIKQNISHIAFGLIALKFYYLRKGTVIFQKDVFFMVYYWDLMCTLDTCCINNALFVYVCYEWGRCFISKLQKYAPGKTMNFFVSEPLQKCSNILNFCSCNHRPSIWTRFAKKWLRFIIVAKGFTVSNIVEKLQYVKWH